MTKKLQSLTAKGFITLSNFKENLKAKFTDQKGDFYVDKMTFVAITIALGAIILLAMTKFFGNETGGFMKMLTDKITAFFNTTTI